VHILSDVVAEVVLEKRMVELFLSWLVWLRLAIVVGIAASVRGRNGSDLPPDHSRARTVDDWWH
jgi:hypothetical protein